MHEEAAVATIEDDVSFGDGAAIDAFDEERVPGHNGGEHAPTGDS
jgi:hypothetical protein